MDDIFVAVLKNLANKDMLRKAYIATYIPKFPQFKTARQLMEEAKKAGLDASLRTVQRDVEELCEVGLIVGVANTRPRRWYRHG